MYILNNKEPMGNLAINFDSSFNQFSKYNTDLSYSRVNTNNYNIQYHDASYQLGNELTSHNINDVSGLSIDNTYYKPGSFLYGSQTYVPNYEDSIFLSKTTRESAVTPIVRDITNMGTGFCDIYSDNPRQLESSCSKLNVNDCASTTCCVLLGGAKCVSGNMQGPTMPHNYNDKTILNRDFYYFQGKCYGNCPETNKNNIKYGSLPYNRLITVDNVK
jgi:hypothetical protein